MANLKELQEKRASLVSQMQGITDKAKAENRNASNEELQSFNQMYEDHRVTDQLITMEERSAELRAKTAQRVEESANENGKSEAEQREAVNTAFRNILLRKVTAKDLDALKSFESRSTDQSKTAGEGGYTVPQGFMAELNKTMLYFGPMLEAGLCRRWNDPIGNDVPWPGTNDTANKAVKVGEGVSVASGTAAVFTAQTFKSYKYTTKIVKYTPELYRDSAFNFEQILADLFGERMGRGLNDAFTTGAGTTDVQGVVTGASAGKTTASETSITASELLDLIHSLDVAYRTGGKLMMNDNTYKYLINLAMSTDIKQVNFVMPSGQAGMPSLFMGYNTLINNDMADIGAGAIPIIFGDFSKYVQRFVGAPTFKTISELYAETDEMGAVMFQTVDGQVLNSAAFKKLTMVNT